MVTFSWDSLLVVRYSILLLCWTVSVKDLGSNPCLDRMCVFWDFCLTGAPGELCCNLNELGVCCQWKGHVARKGLTIVPCMIRLRKWRTSFRDFSNMSYPWLSHGISTRGYGYFQFDSRLYYCIFRTMCCSFL